MAKPGKGLFDSSRPQLEERLRMHALALQQIYPGKPARIRRTLRALAELWKEYGDRVERGEIRRPNPEIERVVVGAVGETLASHGNILNLVEIEDEFGTRFGNHSDNRRAELERLKEQRTAQAANKRKRFGDFFRGLLPNRPRGHGK